MADTTPNVSHSDELSVAVRFVDSETLELEERLVRVSETNDKTGDGQAKDIAKSCRSPTFLYQLSSFKHTTPQQVCLECTMVHNKNSTKFSSEKYRTRNAFHQERI